jgi:hypothetical protein
VLLAEAGMSVFQTTRFKQHYTDVRVLTRKHDMKNFLPENIIQSNDYIVKVGFKKPNTRKVYKTVFYNADAQKIHESFVNN